ncbi:alpha/beta hydrolase family protein [Haloflavibacter putidus]|uniref:Alpha/beta hydrolase n=1 Tax=Haloflavibacter putidus TaxID=2576776 RepID=A0A508A0W4_9FLAO|nr:dienelactone hydrolase family protein [Haloflavibacter putidus]TQD40585.1 alpha/beta hydrolase [Haloflavibacter putidus]
MFREKNFKIPGKHQRPIVTDVFYNPDRKPKPIAIFCHGYKGFKDWGAWNLVAEEFARNNFFFIKFNFSHNGGTAQNPIDFPDLEAFGNDNYTKQLDDLDTIINWITTTKEFSSDADVTKLSLIGHSRGGGIVLLKAANNNLVKKVVTWAGVCNFESRFPSGEKLETWKNEGVYYIENGRTKQKMPHYYQFYEDFQKNKEALSIKRAVKKLNIPQLIVHAKNDFSVMVEEAHQLEEWHPHSELFLLENSNHVFNTKHPWPEKVLSQDLEIVTHKTLEFLK